MKARQSRDRRCKSGTAEALLPGFLGEISRRFPRTIWVCTRLCLIVFVLAFGYAIARPFYSNAPLLAVSALAILVYAGKEPGEGEGEVLPPFTASRLVVFGGMHGVLILAAGAFSRELNSVAQNYSLGATAATSLKLLPLVPSLLLFPISTWRRLGRRYFQELIAALLVLLTFYPFRFMKLIWPAYSNLLVDVVYQCTVPFVTGLYFVPNLDPIVVGPKFALEIVLECSGITGIYLFDTLFGLVVLLEWNRLNKIRALVCYFLGLAVMVAANLFRLILLVLVGNLVSPKLLEGGFHRHAGWVLFALVFLVFLRFAFGWMLSPNPSPSAVSHKFDAPLG